MIRLVLSAAPAAGLTHQDIGKFISETRPQCRNGGVTGMMIRNGGTIHFIIEGPQTAINATASQILSSPLFEGTAKGGAMPIRFRALDKICLAYAKPENLSEDMCREITMLTGLEFEQDALAA